MGRKSGKHKKKLL